MSVLAPAAIGLSQVIYVSRAVPDTDPDADPGSSAEATVQAILRVSIRNNIRSGLTGALLAYGGWYMQVLEGEETAVADMLARIRQDSRHTSLRILHAGPIDHRRFGLWSMCASALSPDDAAIVHVMQMTGGFDPATIEAEAAVLHLIQVGLLQGSEAAQTRTRQVVEDQTT